MNNKQAPKTSKASQEIEEKKPASDKTKQQDGEVNKINGADDDSDLLDDQEEGELEEEGEDSLENSSDLSKKLK